MEVPAFCLWVAMKAMNMSGYFSFKLGIAPFFSIFINIARVKSIIIKRIYFIGD